MLEAFVRRVRAVSMFALKTSAVAALAVGVSGFAAQAAPVRATFQPATFGEAPSARADIDAKEEDCLATAIYFEARGESEEGQKAVAEVILARAQTPGRPKTVCGVVYEGSERKTGCQFSFTCDRASNTAPFDGAWKRAKAIAAEVARGATSIVRGATFYHATSVRPGWASRMVKVAQVGSHIFYRPKAGRYL
jgi:spore germination cell wall hydrolase CwlJ-like protein